MRFLIGAFCLLPLLLSAQGTCGGAQTFQILHFTETQGFDHNTRSQSADMFQALGALDNYIVTNTRDLDEFSSLANLQSYEVIVFANTSGNIPFTDAQKNNLEAYITGGGSVLGIHAATDMYRDGSWFYYSDLLGGSRRNSPAHTSSNYNGTMDIIGNHPTTAGLSDPYSKQEEYYYWPDSGLVAGITEVLRVRATGTDPEDAPRPISWYQEFASGGRSFYTALGHARGNYTDEDNDFRTHLRNAVCWCAEAEAAALPISLRSLSLDRSKDVDLISVSLTATDLHRVELHGGYEQTAAQNLQKIAGATELIEVFEYSPADRSRWFYYRLRFLDFDGTFSWSTWLAAPPVANAALTQVRYGDGEAWMTVSQDGPAAAWIVDANGRHVASLELVVGQNRLPHLPHGMYFVRFPFSKETLRYLVR